MGGNRTGPRVRGQGSTGRYVPSSSEGRGTDDCHDLPCDVCADELLLRRSRPEPSECGREHRAEGYFG